jgi:autotransporter translocation and assembly factor TamB
MSVEGQWNVTMDTPLGTQQFSLNFRQAGGAWSGTMTGDKIGTAELTSLKVEGTSVSFETKVNSPMGPLSVTMSGSVNGSALTGVCKTMFGNMDFKGARA